MIEQKQITISLLPSQHKFLNSTKKEVLFSGAWRAGKSRVLCYALLKQVIKNPNNTVLLCRKTFNSLKNTTLNTLLRGDNNDPVLPKGSYSHHQADHYIDLKGGGRINYAGLDDPLKIRSMSLGAVALDEAIEFSEDEFYECIGRLSLPSGTRQIFLATNPHTPEHWIYKRFFVNKNDSKESVTARTIDNPYLPSDYLDYLKEMPETLYKRFALGEWIALENVVYPQWDDKYIKIRHMGEFSEFRLGVDFGFTNPAALALIGIDGDNNLHLLEEIKESKLLIGSIVDRANKWKKMQPIVVVDPSAPALAAEFDKDGWDVKSADNTIFSGIARMQDALHKGKFTVDPSCTEFVKEIKNYVYNSKGKPVKLEDHLLDATRYIINDLVGEPTSHAFAMDLDSEQDSD